MNPIPSKMKGPAEQRWDGHHHGVVIQIKITTYCDLDCRACTAAVGLLKKHKAQWHMTPDQFRAAVRSLKGFPGMIGIFGGNPCISPHFEEICAIFREEVPDITRRGLWSNRLFGHGETCRQTFYGPHSNINVHRNTQAFEEIRRDWPEAKPFGERHRSWHGSWWTAMSDLIPDEAERWKLIENCYVNQTWSAEITLIQNQLRGFFCEFAATQAEFEALAGRPDLGLPIEPGWWNHNIQHYAEQVRKYCHACGAPLNPRKVEDLSKDAEDFTATHAPIFLSVNGRASRQVNSLDEIQSGAPATHYI